MARVRGLAMALASSGVANIDELDGNSNLAARQNA